MKNSSTLKSLLLVFGLLALIMAMPAAAGTASEVRELKKEIETLQQGQEQIQNDLAEIKKLLKQGARTAPGQAAAPAPFEPTDLLVGESAYLGSTDAPVTMFGYSDYQCPFCSRHATMVLPGLVKQYVDSGKLKIVMKEFPIESLHSRAFAASQATLCADAQGKYWEMHDLVFANQRAMTDDNFIAHSETLGLDATAFEACLTDEETSERIRAEILEGQGLGISGTPSFVVGLTDPEDSNKVHVTEYIRGAQPLPRFEGVINELLEEVAGVE